MAALLPRRRRHREPPRRPRFVVDIELADGSELAAGLRAQGLACDEVVFKYFWPRYAPPPEAGIQSVLKSEHLGAQFERVLAMHLVVPSGIPQPAGVVRNREGELVGYVLERIEGVTLGELVERGASAEAQRQVARVEQIVAKLHAKGLAHGDLTPANVIASDDGRTILIDPIPHPGPGAKLQDELLLEQLRALARAG